jgi:beta-lactamase superfamily II metal-dependent hydrolase
LQGVHDKLKANVLKIAHHGSETSSSLPFIQAVDPDVVVVSSGRKDFGPHSPLFLPDKSTLQRYCSHKASTRIYRTDQNDAQEARTEGNDADSDNVLIRTNGTELQVQAFENGMPFTVTSCSP